MQHMQSRCRCWFAIIPDQELEREIKEEREIRENEKMVTIDVTMHAIPRKLSNQLGFVSFVLNVSLKLSGGQVTMNRDVHRLGWKQLGKLCKEVNLQFGENIFFEKIYSQHRKIRKIFFEK